MPRYRYAIVEHVTYSYAIIASDATGQSCVYAEEHNFPSAAAAQAAAEALIAKAGDGE